MRSRLMMSSLLLVCIAQGSTAQAQAVPAEQDGLRLSTLFPVQLEEYEGEHFPSADPDSMRGHIGHEARCSALWAYHMYLFNNYCNVYLHTKELAALLPDTPQVQARYDALMQADTAFQQVMAPALHGSAIPALHIDSALRIAARFYYVHREGEDVVTHLCVGINKVKELGTAVADAHYAAFAYMTVRSMDDPYAPYNPVAEPYRKEMRGKPSDKRLREVEHLVYDGLAASPELRAALIAEYERKKEFLPFALVQ